MVDIEEKCVAVEKDDCGVDLVADVLLLVFAYGGDFTGVLVFGPVHT